MIVFSRASGRAWLGNHIQLPLTLTLSHPGNGIKLREFLLCWKLPPRRHSPGVLPLATLQTPRWGVSISPGGAVDGSRGFYPRLAASSDASA